MRRVIAKPTAAKTAENFRLAEAAAAERLSP
jgi:hypothetical protein